MDLIQAQIAEIKNLNAIYVFTTDNILKDNSNKYIGARVVYDKDKVLSLDYKSEHFEEFIKKVLIRYNKEKSKRNIILLGDLTEKLVQDSFFTITEEKEKFTQSSGILVNAKRSQVKSSEKYLEKIIKVILKTIKNYNYVTIDSIDGFNYKYVVNYSIGNIKKQLYMLIIVKEDGNVDFRITNIEDINVNINGTIEDNFTNVKINWYEDTKKLKGSITYDSKEQIMIEQLYKNEQPIISRETEDTVLEEDENIISFYMELCDLDMLKNIIKVDENCYLLSEDKVLADEKDGIFYYNVSCQISIFSDQVIVKHREKNGISKYNDQIKAVLEEVVKEFTLKKIEIENKFYILIEKRINKNGINSYNYSVLSLDNNNSLFMPFKIKNKQNINEEMKTLDTAKQYIKNIKGGKRYDSV